MNAAPVISDTKLDIPYHCCYCQRWFQTAAAAEELIYYWWCCHYVYQSLYITVSAVRADILPLLLLQRIGLLLVQLLLMPKTDYLLLPLQDPFLHTVCRCWCQRWFINNVADGVRTSLVPSALTDAWCQSADVAVAVVAAATAGAVLVL